ncbi:MAG: hypothetical protein AB7O56_04855 [Bauldia sp.]
MAETTGTSGRPFMDATFADVKTRPAAWGAVLLDGALRCHADRIGKVVDWLEHVTDADYGA